MELRVWKCEIPWLIINDISMYSLTNTPISIANTCLDKYCEISLCGLVFYTEIKPSVRPGRFIKEFLVKLQSKTRVYLYP